MEAIKDNDDKLAVLEVEASLQLNTVASVASSVIEHSFVDVEEDDAAEMSATISGLRDAHQHGSEQEAGELSLQNDGGWLRDDASREDLADDPSLATETDVDQEEGRFMNNSGPNTTSVRRLCSISLIKSHVMISMADSVRTATTLGESYSQSQHDRPPPFWRDASMRSAIATAPPRQPSLVDPALRNESLRHNRTFPSPFGQPSGSSLFPLSSHPKDIESNQKISESEESVSRQPIIREKRGWKSFCLNKGHFLILAVGIILLVTGIFFGLCGRNNNASSSGTPPADAMPLLNTTYSTLGDFRSSLPPSETHNQDPLLDPTAP